jgi:hypothetical protein
MVGSKCVVEEARTLTSALRSVPKVNQTVVELAFIEKFELHGDLAWQVGIAAARDDRRDEQVTFVDEAGANGMRCERRTAYPNISGGSCLEDNHRAT